MMIFSCRIMKKHVSFDSEISFMTFGWKWFFLICAEKCVSWISMKEKVLKLVEKCFVLRKQVRSLSFHTSKFFSHSTTSMEWKILKTQTKSSLLSKISSKTLTPRLLSLSPKLNGENETHRVENGGSIYKIIGEGKLNSH